MARLIILVQRTLTDVFPLLDVESRDADAPPPTARIFKSEPEAEIVASNTMACQSWPWSIVDLDSLAIR